MHTCGFSSVKNTISYILYLYACDVLLLLTGNIMYPVVSYCRVCAVYISNPKCSGYVKGSYANCKDMYKAT